MVKAIIISNDNSNNSNKVDLQMKNIIEKKEKKKRNRQTSLT